MSVILPLYSAGDHGMRIVGADVLKKLIIAFQFFDQVLREIDSTQINMNLVAVANVLDAGYASWVDVEPDNNTNSFPMRMGGDPETVALAPPIFTRAALKNEHHKICEDFLALLRREFKRS
ncbi:MAG: hypothetical protein JKX88_09550 [Marinicaulis sp.]|nr:hypothetical protein [Marinicaulis sp.]